MRFGFTLVESLMFVIILLLLTGISYKHYLMYKQNAVVGRIQGDLISCASELMAEYADNGTKRKVCVVYTNETCVLQVSENGDFIKFANNYCDFNLGKKTVRCSIVSDYGNVIANINCFIVKKQ